MLPSEYADEGNKWDNGGVKKFCLIQSLEKLKCKEPIGSKFQHTRRYHQK